jgi:hypothetical protein
MRRALPVLWLATLLAAVAHPASAQERVVRGRVLELRDSSAVLQVLVEILGTRVRAFTDSTGAFVLRGAPARDLLITGRAPAFRPDTAFVPFNRDTLTLYLPRLVLQLEPVEVRGEPQVAPRVRFEDIAQPSVISMTGEEMRAAAPSLLEPDVIRTVQLLPGTVAKNDYSIGYNVRGGEADQNLVLLDGVTVFNPSHLGGLFSTFDADAIGQTEFLTGGFPAGYSGRLSSVLDIGIRPGDTTRVHGAAGISLLSSKLLLEGPLPGRTSWLTSVRRTYLDAVVSAFTKEVLPYYFTDALSKLQVPTRGGGYVSLTGYWGRDALDFPLVDSSAARDPVNLVFDWGNAILGLTWRQPLGASHLETRASVSDFSSTLGLLPNLARFDNDASVWSGQLAFEPGLGPRHVTRLGAGVEHYAMHYAVSSPTLNTTFFTARYVPTVWSSYVDEQWTPARRLRLRPGLRVEHIPEAGFTGLSPRIAYKVFLTPDFALTGSAGRYYQPIHSIRDQELPITIYEFWIGADQHVPVARSDHLVLGFEGWVNPTLQFTLEGYKKTFDNLVTPNPAQDLRVEGDEFIPASGDAWGFDALLRRHLGRVTGWIAYSFTKATREAAGVTYPPAHDRRHTLNVVLQAPGPLGSAMSLRWGYGSPLPYTGWLGQWDHRFYSAIENQFVEYLAEPISGPINGERYPPYSRLDVGFRWSFKKWGARWEPYLQAVNLFNRQNVFFYFFDYGAAPPTRTGVSQLPILPTFGLEVRF